MEYLIHILIMVGIYAIIAVALNLVVGYTGLLSLAHSAFYGVSAYTIAILLTRFEFNFFVALLLAMIFSGLAAFLIGLVLSRFRGDYYALASLGFAYIVYGLFLNLDSITRGPMGIPGVPRPTLFGFSFGDNLAFLVLVIVLGALAYLISWTISQSSFGRVLKAIREREETIAVFGYRTHTYKLTVFVVSAVLVAIGGALFASYIQFVDPSTFTINESILLLAMIILGGLGTVRGSFLGAACLVILPEAMRFLGFPDDVAAQMRQVVYGLILIVLMFVRPQGLVGEYKL